MKWNGTLEEPLSSYEEQIRDTVKLTIRTLEIFVEELEKSNLPEKYKEAILTGYINNSNKQELILMKIAVNAGHTKIGPGSGAVGILKGGANAPPFLFGWIMFFF